MCTYSDIHVYIILLEACIRLIVTHVVMAHVHLLTLKKNCRTKIQLISSFAINLPAEDDRYHTVLS